MFQIADDFRNTLMLLQFEYVFHRHLCYSICIVHADIAKSSHRVTMNHVITAATPI